MPSSLLQEHTILVPVSLAATLGLEQAVLLQVIAECLRHKPTQWHDNYCWLSLEANELLALLPFWTLEKTEQIATQLEAQGIIRLAGAEIALGKKLILALNETVAAPVRHEDFALPTQAWQQPNKEIATAVDSWTLSEALIEKLQKLHGIHRDFITRQAAEFQLYWRDRDEREVSWDGKFESRVVQQWRSRAEETAAGNGRFTPKAVLNIPLAADWSPSEDAVQILQRTGVAPEFIQEAIPEFVLYWRERGEALKTWNSKFIAHIRRQWARYANTLQHDTEPKLLADDWNPSEDVYDILQMANIDRDFACQQLPEFMLFWRDSKQMHASWNSKFLQHVKYQWAQQHRYNQDGDGSGYLQQATGNSGGGFIEKHTDKSWRKGLKT